MQAVQAVTSRTEKMVRLITEITHALVDSPDDVSITLVEEDGRTAIQLRVAHQDIGKVIGKQGRTARALRAIITGAGMKLGHRFGLDIVDGKEIKDKTDEGFRDPDSAE